jgi:hypothetical protein
MDLSNALKSTLKEEIWEEISEKFMKKISDIVNQNVRCTQVISRHQNERTYDDTETNKGT